MDGLSVVASVVGILAASGKIVEILGPVISSLKDATTSASAIYGEVNSTRVILSALQTLLDDLESSPENRRELIQVDQLLATLTDGTLIFSELEPLVLQLCTSAQKRAFWIQWTLKKGTLETLVTRLQHFKSSINVMLNILQW